MLIFPSFFNAGPATYEIEQSIKFDDNRGAYLNRTPSSAGNRQIWNYSGWFKRGRTGFRQQILNSTSGAYIEFVADDTIRLEEYTGTVQWTLKTNAVYRDMSAWYHIVVAFDSTQSTSSDRIKLWINGEQVTSFSSSSYPALNHSSQMNTASEHRIGRYYTSSADYLDGYLAEVNFVEGSALDHEDFGEYNTDGVWVAKKYAGSYTGNSFYLKFEQGALGTDSSGLGNNWTTNELWEEIGTPDYAGTWIGSTSGSFYSGSWENVFNGDVTVGSNYVYAYQNTATLTFSTPLTGVIEVFGSDGGAGNANSGYIALSDGSSWSINSVARANAQWHSFGSKSNITTITVSSPGGHGAILGAIRVDGDLLANISAKANYVNMADTPTTNYATLNPLWARNTYGLSTLSNGNLVFSDAGISTSWGGRGSTFEISSGKWYMEWHCHDSSGQNLVLAVLNTGHHGLEHFMVQNPQSQTGCWGPQENGSSRWIILDGVQTTSGAPYYDTLNHVIVGIAIDADAGTATWYRNGTAITSLTDVDISTSSEDAWVVMGITSNGSGTSFDANFGQRDFEYTPPTGYSAWNTSNLPAPTVKDGSEYFQTVTYTGTSSTQSISTPNLSPDVVWIKDRGNIFNHQLFDTIRGVNSSLLTNLTSAENNYNSFTSFDSTGFTVPNVNGTGANGNNHVAWTWEAGGSGSSNTDGSSTSTVSANPTAGFSIVSYTGTMAAATVGHGLGVAPDFIITKNRDSSRNWRVQHASLGPTKYLSLNLSDAAGTASSVWNNTAPTSTVFSVANDGGSNGNTEDIIAYCFAEVEGYSKFGSYTGNGNADGPFVYCGFRPAWIMVKNTTTAQGWYISDNKRDTYNQVNRALFASSNSAESSATTGASYDFLSNGFKPRTSNNDSNGSNDVYVFMAFAENPFGGDGVSPATAR